MDVPIVATNLSQQPSSITPATLDPAIDAALSGAPGGADLFAALLAQQMGQGDMGGKVSRAGVPGIQAPEEKADSADVPGSGDAVLAAMMNPAAVDPTSLAQQAAIVSYIAPTAVSHVADVSVQAGQADVTADAMATDIPVSVPGSIADTKAANQRQPIAADSATFAIPQEVAQPAKGEDLVEGVRQATAAARDKVAEPTTIQLPAVDKSIESKLSAGESAPPFSQVQQVIAAPSAVVHPGSVNHVSVTQAPTQAVSSIAPQVGHSAWGESLSDRVVWMVGQNHQGVELHLNPPSLGPLEVRLSMNDGQANLSFATQHLTVKEAIDSATPRLREMLGDSGISLGSVSVNVGSFTQQGPGDQTQQFSSGRAVWPDTPSVTDFSMIPQSVISQQNRNGLVDTFA